MNLTEQEITGDAARCIRERLGLTQSEFWAPLGVKQSVGSRYEGNYAEIPQSVRILLVTHYVAGVKIDAASADGVAGLAVLGSIQASNSAARELRPAITKAVGTLQKAADSLKTL